MSVQINCETEQGGAVSLNKEKDVWASYAVAGVIGERPAELLYAGARLDNGRSVAFFLNRKTGLATVTVTDEDGEGGTELLRTQIGENVQGRRYLLMPLEEVA